MERAAERNTCTPNYTMEHLYIPKLERHSPNPVRVPVLVSHCLAFVTAVPSPTSSSESHSAPLRPELHYNLTSSHLTSSHLLHFIYISHTTIGSISVTPPPPAPPNKYISSPRPSTAIAKCTDSPRSYKGGCYGELKPRCLEFKSLLQ